MNKVSILSVGYSKIDPLDSNCMLANCSCTLIQSHCGKNIIVDTMTAWDSDAIVDALKQHSIAPKDINYVVCTHGHSDHIGSNHLFTNAEYHFVGACISNRNRYPNFDWEQPFQLVGDEIQVIRTPGHTLSCVSLLVKNVEIFNTVGVCGDLFENKNDVWDSSIWLDAGSESPKLQIENRYKMANICNYIIPGHGEGFHVTHEIKNKLKYEMQAE